MDQQPTTHDFHAQGAAERTPEFDRQRHALISELNTWLGEQVRRRDAGEALGDRPIRRDARLRRSGTGPSPAGVVRVRREEYEPGLSVRGDGWQRPIRLQSVTVHPHSGRVEIVTVMGTDPFATHLFGNRFSPMRRDERVAFFASLVLQAQRGSYLEFTVMGDGSVHHAALAPDGNPTTRPVRTVVDLHRARAAFRRLSQGLEQPARGLG